MRNLVAVGAWLVVALAMFSGSVNAQAKEDEGMLLSEVAVNDNNDNNRAVSAFYYKDLEDEPNPNWSDLVKTLDVGKNSMGPALGSTIRVHHKTVISRGGGSSVFASRDIPMIRPIGLHVPTHSNVRPGSFKNLTRWYQEDGTTQIFRLFPGDDNVRNKREFAPRSEAFSLKSWRRGEGWHEWSGHYNFLKVRDGAVFQIKHNSTYWSMQLVLNENPVVAGVFDLYYQKLRDPAAKTLLLKDVVNKGVDIRVLDDGTNHKIYVDHKLVVENKMTDRRSDEDNRARWGMYTPRSAMDREILIFVTGVYVGPAQDGLPKEPTQFASEEQERILSPVPTMAPGGSATLEPTTTPLHETTTTEKNINEPDKTATLEHTALRGETSAPDTNIYDADASIVSDNTPLSTAASAAATIGLEVSMTILILALFR